MFPRENKQLSLFEARRLERPGLPDADVVRSISRDVITETGVRPPVPVDLLASFRGIATIIDAEIDSAGMLSSAGDRLVVHVRSSDGIERRRFTILHEAGHTYLPGFADRVQRRCSPGDTRSRTEQLCDIAAVELLFPYQFFRADLAARAMDLASAEDLSAIYAASVESTALRMVELTDEPVIFMSLRHQLKPSQVRAGATGPPALRVSYSRETGEWPFVPRHKSVGEETPFGRAFDGEIVDEVARVSDPFVAPVEQVRVSARRYGSRVLALIRAA